jgi:hypothetical protein
MGRSALSGISRVGWLGAASLMLASGCGFLLDVESADSSGPCIDKNGCPTGMSCVDGTCQDSCKSDHDCQVGLACIETDGGSACLMAMVPDAGRPSSDASVVVADASMTTASSDSEASAAADVLEEASCPACDPVLQACVDGACRQVEWASPQSDYAEPQPLPLDQRSYAGLDANKLYAQRIQIDHACTVVKLGVLASTGQKPYAFRLALYHDNGGFPLDPFVTPPAQIPVSDPQGPGRQEVAVAPQVHLTPGIYWMAFVAQGSAFVVQSTLAAIATAESTTPATGDPWLDPFPFDSQPPMTTTDDAIIMYAAVAIDP